MCTDDLIQSALCNWCAVKGAQGDESVRNSTELKLFKHVSTKACRAYVQQTDVSEKRTNQNKLNGLCDCVMIWRVLFENGLKGALKLRCKP